MEIVVPLRRGRSLLLHRRALATAALLLLAALAVSLGSLLTGAYRLSAADALAVLAGSGSDLDRFIVLDQRLPRALAALLVGAMLALSGAVFQSLSRNPLGSPDIVGFTRGATTGGLVVILLASASSLSMIALGTILGGFATAALVVLVALRRGASGDALILAGIALSQMLAAGDDYLLTPATIESAETAKAWQFGSLNAITWAQVRPLMVAALLLLPLIAWLGRPAGILELGDDAANSLGLGAARARGTLLGYGVVLAAVCVAVSGPIAFLALAAPQLARRASRSAGIALAASAAMGALLLALADFLAARLLSPFQIPVGLVSAACGGLYLLWFVGLRRQEQ
ncbi:FecCD family ABC transporter permease [Actinomyces timonensis]|uniref:FecCD family ABC transporter permease n=1 Tax=Actinomyces timonensis TaxID=1288391 RepID=UPI000303EF8F|nr:iron chelate uptake ABC transporter family permease subunit [Actinomyces timonensis]